MAFEKHLEYFSKMLVISNSQYLVKIINLSPQNSILDFIPFFRDTLNSKSEFIICSETSENHKIFLSTAFKINFNELQESLSNLLCKQVSDVHCASSMRD